MIPVVLFWLMALNAFVIIQFYIPNEILHLHADAVGLLSADKAGSFRPKGKTEQGVNFLTSWSRVDVPGREEQQPHSGSHTPSGSCEIYLDALNTSTSHSCLWSSSALLIMTIPFFRFLSFS